MDKSLIEVCQKKINKEIDKSWEEIAKEYNYNGNGESLRCSYKKYRKKNGVLPSKEKVIDKNIENKLTEIQIQEINLKKERIRLQDLRTSINKDIRNLARQESLTELIKESIKDLKPLEFQKPMHIYGEDDEMVIQISDCHFGLTVDNEFEKYNEEVFINRFTNYMKKILDIKKLHNINKCHVCFSGDVLSGIIHENITRNNEFGIVEQTKRFSEYASKFIEKLSNNFEEVIIHFVTGNHSRNNEDKQKAENKDRYENFVIEFIKLRTHNLKNIKIEESILNNTVSCFDSKGYFCVLAHGDYTNPKTAPMKLFTLLDRKPKMVFLGHRHIYEVLTVDKCKVITSGVFVTHDEYCTNNQLFGEVSQTVTIVGKEGFITAYDCKLR